MRLRRLVVSLVVLLVSPFAVVAGDESAEQWLHNMVQASRQVSFNGQSVLLSGNRITTLSVFHAAVDGEVWERVVHMSGAPSEVIRKGNQVLCRHARQSTRMSANGPAERLSALEKGLQSASHFYQFERRGQDRIAGRDAIRVDVIPKDRYRFGYSLWLDRENGILLKSQTNPLEGDPMDVFEFVQVTFVDKPDLSQFEVQGSDMMMASEPSETPQAVSGKATTKWQVQWLPDGFYASHNSLMPNELNGVDARVYTDGLAAFTVFYDSDSSAMTESVRQMGTTVAVNRPIGQDLLTVVGEIPLETAQKVAQSAQVGVQ